jgi:putative endonuclease
VGRWGESLAAAFLSERGFEVLERNARTPYGELDLVARTAGVIVFVEVKTRTSTAYGWPEESISAEKRQHLQQAAASYLQEHPELEGDWRIDVIAILGDPRGGPVEITHFDHAFG